MEWLSIGEFARLSQLSPKALRLYDELELLPPARVDPDSGYRFYEAGQLGRARLVSSLRQIGVPLAQIKAMLDLEPGTAAQISILPSRCADRALAGRRPPAVVRRPVPSPTAHLVRAVQVDTTLRVLDA